MRSKANRKLAARFYAVTAVVLLLVAIVPRPMDLVLESVSATGISATGADLPSAREGTSAIYDGQHVYVFGGKGKAAEQGAKGKNAEPDQNFLADIVRFDPATNQATTLDVKLPSGREGTSAVFDGTHAYIIGGKGTGGKLNEIVRFTPGTGDVLSLAAKLPSAREGTSAIWHDSAIYVFGGHGSGTTNEIVRCDTNECSVIGRLPSARTQTSAVFAGRYAYVFGGFGADPERTDSPRLSDIIRFDPTTGTATMQPARLPTGRAATAAFFDGTSAYILGGKGIVAGTDQVGRLNEVIRFRPSAGTTDLIASELPKGLELHSAAFAGDDAFVFGGRSDGLQAAIYRFDLDRDAPIGLVASAGPLEHQISLTWEAPAAGAFADNIDGYRIYRGTAPGQETLLIDDHPADSFAYVDTGLPAGAERHYRVTAFSSDGEGGFSNQASASTYSEPPPPLPACLEQSQARYMPTLGATYIVGGTRVNCADDGSALEAAESQGGGTDGDSSEIVKYDPESGEVTVLGTSLPPKCCAFLEGGDGGDDERCCEELLPRGPGAASLVDPVLYLFGGSGEEERCCDDDERGSMTSLIGLEEHAMDAPDPTAPLADDIFVFDPRTETIREIDANLPRTDCALVGLPALGYIYLFAVNCASDPNVPIGDIWRFDPATETLVDTGNVLPNEVCCAFAQFASETGTGFLFGRAQTSATPDPAAPGIGPTVREAQAAGCDILEFDPLTENIVETVCNELPRCCFDGDENGEGDIVLMGGDEGDDERCCEESGSGRNAAEGDGPSSAIFIFDPTTRSLRRAPESLDEARRHAPAEFDGQRILIFGGNDGEQSLSSVESYDPSSPQGLSAASGPERGEITLSWQAPTGESPAAYKVYRRSGTESHALLAQVPGSNTTYTDSGLDETTTYTYAVASTDGTSESPMSDEASSAPQGAPPPEPEPDPGPTGVVYSNNFEAAGPTPEWSGGVRRQVSTTANGCTSQVFCGTQHLTVGDGTTTLTIAGLPAHDALQLDFDLLFISSWDGENTQWGPDRVTLTADGVTLLAPTSFSNVDEDPGFLQSYPAASASSTTNPPYTGSFERDTLGSCCSFYGNSVYRFPNGDHAFSFAHSADSVVFTFVVDAWQATTDCADECLGIDNVVVSASAPPAPGPEPARTLVFGQDFESESTTGSHWTGGSLRTISTQSNGCTSAVFCGTQHLITGGGNTTLTVENLPAHDRIEIEFDLFLINSWDGEAHANPPVRERISLHLGATTLLAPTSFSNIDEVGGYPQSYPASVASGTTNPPYFGAFERDTLGNCCNFYGSSVHRFPNADHSFVVAHTGSSAVFRFFVQSTEANADCSNECLGIDNVLVYVRTAGAAPPPPPSDPPAPAPVFERVGALWFGPSERDPAAAVIDTQAGYAYVGWRTADNDNQAGVVKVRLSDMARVDVLEFDALHERLASAIIDVENGFAYFGTESTVFGGNHRVIRIRLSDFTQTGALLLPSNLRLGPGAVLDPTNGMAYLATMTNPGNILKVRLSDLTLVSQLSVPEMFIRAGVIDTINGFAYFGDGTTAGGFIVKIRLSDFTRVGSLALASGERIVLSASLDSVAGMAYFGTNVVPGRIVKVQLSDFTRVGAIQLANNQGIGAAAVDPIGRVGYFATRTNNPANIFQVDLDTFTITDTETLLAGEYFVQTALPDFAHGFTYFSVGADQGGVVKVRTPPILPSTGGQEAVAGSICDDGGTRAAAPSMSPCAETGADGDALLAPDPPKDSTLGLGTTRRSAGPNEAQRSEASVSPTGGPSAPSGPPPAAMLA